MRPCNKATFERLKKKFEGEVFESQNCGSFTVLEYFSANRITVRFTETGATRTCDSKAVLSGGVKDLLKPTVYGVGFIGDGEYTSTCPNTGKNMRSYVVWKDILRRCYSHKEREKFRTYDGCTVAEIWHNYQNFAQWYNIQVGNDMGYQVDKDILHKGNREYSPDNCCLVPKHLNILTACSNKLNRGLYPIGVHFDKCSKKFTASMQAGKGMSERIGLFSNPEDAFKAYKKNKEKRIQEVATNLTGLIDDRVLVACLNYVVEITD